jgi:hypothetical protein
MVVVAEDLDALAVILGAEERLDPLREQHVELVLGRPGDDHTLLAIPDRDRGAPEDRLRVVWKERDPAVMTGIPGEGGGCGEPQGTHQKNDSHCYVSRDEAQSPSPH